MQQGYIVLTREIIINYISKPIFSDDGYCVNVKQHTKHSQNERYTHFSTMAATIVPQPPWCPPPGAKAYSNQSRPFNVVSVRQGNGR